MAQTHCTTDGRRQTMMRRPGLQSLRAALYDQCMNVPEIAQTARKVTIGEEVSGGMNDHVVMRQDG